MICPKILAMPTATKSTTRLHQHSRYRIDVKKKKKRKPKFLIFLIQKERQIAWLYRNRVGERSVVHRTKSMAPQQPFLCAYSDPHAPFFPPHMLALASFFTMKTRVEFCFTKSFDPLVMLNAQGYCVLSL